MKIRHRYALGIFFHFYIFTGISHADVEKRNKENALKELVGYCGDGIVNGNEHCDGKALSVSSCKSLGVPQEGVIKCQPNCVFDISRCFPAILPPSQLLPAGPERSNLGFCGDGIINGDEYCDGTTLSDTRCTAFNGLGGEVRCKQDCKLDISECVLEPLRQERAIRDRTE